MKKVMIVDDDKSVINGLTSHISWESLNMEVVETASNGDEALEKIRESQPDILITDIYMPRMNGLELIKAVNEEWSSIYIIIHSGYNDFENAREAIRYGVKHFFLKPSTVGEIESVLAEISKEIDVEEKQKSLLSLYQTQLDDYLVYSKEALIRQMLAKSSYPDNISNEKLRLLNLSPNSNITVASIVLIRPPYLTKSKESEWQLMKLTSGNIINDLLKSDQQLNLDVDIHVIDYTDSTFILVFMTKDLLIDLKKLCLKLLNESIENILLYSKLSSNVGIGGVKYGLEHIHTSFLESQIAIEAAEYQEMNKVFTFDEVYESKEPEPFHYPFEIVKELHNAIHSKEYEQLLEIWERYEHKVVQERTPLYIVQNISISIMNVLIINTYSDEKLKNNTPIMTDLVSKIYTQPSIPELLNWMKIRLKEWQSQMKEELSEKKSNKLVRAVKDRVHNYYDQEIILAEIAESLHVNRNYLSQLFKKATGESFVTYLNKYRIEKAKEKLREQHYMVYEISEMVGYQNPTYFSQVFKSITGVSPSDYYN